MILKCWVTNLFKNKLYECFHSSFFNHRVCCDPLTFRWFHKGLARNQTNILGQPTHISTSNKKPILIIIYLYYTATRPHRYFRHLYLVVVTCVLVIDIRSNGNYSPGLVIREVSPYPLFLF